MCKEKWFAIFSHVNHFHDSWIGRLSIDTRAETSLLFCWLENFEFLLGVFFVWNSLLTLPIELAKLVPQRWNLVRCVLEFEKCDVQIDTLLCDSFYRYLVVQLMQNSDFRFLMGKIYWKMFNHVFQEAIKCTNLQMKKTSPALGVDVVVSMPNCMANDLYEDIQGISPLRTMFSWFLHVPFAKNTYNWKMIVVIAW